MTQPTIIIIAKDQNIKDMDDLQEKIQLLVKEHFINNTVSKGVQTEKVKEEVKGIQTKVLTTSIEIQTEEVNEEVNEEVKEEALYETEPIGLPTCLDTSPDEEMENMFKPKENKKEEKPKKEKKEKKPKKEKKEKKEKKSEYIDFKFKPLLKEITEKTFTKKGLNELNRIGENIINHIIEETENDINIMKVVENMVINKDVYKNIENKVNEIPELMKNKKVKKLDKKAKLKIKTKELIKYIDNVKPLEQENIVIISKVIEVLIKELMEVNMGNIKVKKITDKHIQKNVDLDLVIDFEKKLEQEEIVEEELPETVKDESEDEEELFEEDNPIETEVQDNGLEKDKTYKYTIDLVDKYNLYNTDPDKFEEMYVDDDDMCDAEEIYDDVKKYIVKHRKHLRNIFDETGDKNIEKCIKILETKKY